MKPPASSDMLLILMTTAVLLAAASFVTGATLGMFFAGMILAAMLAPFAAMLRDDWPGRLMSAGGVCDGVALVWLVAVVGGHVSLLQWLSCYVLLVTFAFAAASVAWLFRAIRLNAILSSSLATACALAWLSAPIWMSPNVSAAALQRMAGAHPLLAINGVIAHLGVWTEQPIMYRMSRLGQDVAYQFPNAWLVALAHAIIATVLISAALALRRSDAPCDPPTRSTPPPAPTS